MDDLNRIRELLEAVAQDFGEKWSWDAARMHLLISDHDGNPIATLHVEAAN